MYTTFWRVLQTLCKSEAANRPCPRIILVCCTALVTGGLSAEGLFQQEASDDLVHFLFGAFEEGVVTSFLQDRRGSGPASSNSMRIIKEAFDVFPLSSYSLSWHAMCVTMSSCIHVRCAGAGVVMPPPGEAPCLATHASLAH